MPREHGTLACYKHGCRRPECRAQNRAYDNHRSRMVAYGRPTTTQVDAEPVRQHVLALMQAGMSLRSIGEAADVPKSSLQHLVYGIPSAGRPKLSRMKPDNARRLMSVQASLDALPDSALVDVAGSRRRVLSLAVVGYPLFGQAEELGYEPRYFCKQIMRSPQVTARMARGVRDLFDAWWDVLPQAKVFTARTQRWARSKGGIPPVSWDDDLIDLPEEELQEELDRRVSVMDVAELRRCVDAHEAGDRSPLIVAAAREFPSRRNAFRRAQRAAAKKHTAAA